MLSFAASVLRGRARDGSLAAIMVVSLDLAGSIPGPASLWGFPTAQPGNPRVTLSPAHRPEPDRIQARSSGCVSNL